jgi:hypothetical protein
MTASEPVWFEFRDGNPVPFCKKRNRQVVAVTMREAGVWDAPLTGIHYRCEGCGANASIPATTQ